MMKSFFKKLAFVMALAMVVSAMAPAAQASAADALGIVLQGDDTWTVKETDEVELGVEDLDYRYKGAPKNYKELSPTWDSTDKTVADVDQSGKITTFKAGETTITIALSNGQKGELKLTVKAPVAPLTVEQTTDKEIKLTLDAKTTKADLEAGLTFYYYVGDVKVYYPIQVTEVKDGVAKLTSYVTFIDGTKYGVEYAGEKDEFVATIGEVAKVVVTWKCGKDAMKAYAGESTTISAKLLNAKGIDITSSAVNGVDKYVKYTLVEEAAEGEFYIPNEMEGVISFDSEKVGAIAKVKVEYVTGKYDDNYEAIPGAYEIVPIVSEKAPAYGMDMTKVPSVTILTPGDDGNYSTDFSKNSTVIALNDETDKMEGARLVAQFVDTKGDKVKTYDALANFEFESTNNGILYVDQYGYLMTNSVGKVNVIIYYIPDASNTNVKTVVGVATVDVREARSASTMGIDKTSAVVSTNAPYNEAEFKLTFKDKLQDKYAVKVGDIKVECITKKPTGASDVPSVSAVAGSNGEYTFTIYGDEDVLPVVNGKQATTYSYTFKASYGNLSKQFTVRVNKPDGKVQGVEVAITGGTDLKTENDSAKALNVTVYELSNGVRNGVIEVAPKVDKSKATAGKYYYTITRDGKDITGKATGSSIGIDLTTINATDEFEAGTASGQSLDVVKKEATGTYTVTVYYANGEAGKTATGFVSKKSASVTVTDTQATMSYAGKKSNSYSLADGASVEELVKACFAFKLGGNDVDYSKVEYVVDANVPVSGLTAGSVCFVNSVDFYVLVGKSTYVKYTVQVNNYVEVK